MVVAFKLLGALGLLLITAGVLTKNRRKQDTLYIAGGLLLESYSISIRDPIFITLQAIFVVAAAYDLAKTSEFADDK